MGSTDGEETRWDVSIALRDICVEMLEYHGQGLPVDALTVRRWHEWIHKAALAHSALAVACESLVEEGATPEHIAAVKQALTRAMGQDTYWARRDRW